MLWDLVAVVLDAPGCGFPSPAWLLVVMSARTWLRHPDKAVGADPLVRARSKKVVLTPAGVEFAAHLS
ncbi:MAG: hypothetical protein ABWX68_10480 [Arthrobacter sp.]|uniref:hypothetical protein n=1 Tax=Arthrobacter sp. TaxID=1667 RepID=UPI0034696C55